MLKNPHEQPLSAAASRATLASSADTALRNPWQHLVTVVQQLSLARNMQSIMAIVRRAARELTGADGATFVLREGDQCFYADEDAIAPLWKGKRFPMNICISGWVMLNRRPTVITDIYVDPRIPADAYRPTFVKSLAMVPIRTQAPLGAIGNYWATSHVPTDDEVAILCALADTTSVAMESVSLYQELEARVKERTRDLEDANRELEAFTSAISHDLRSPLTAIKGFTEILQRKLASHLDPSSKDMFCRILNDASRTEDLITSLLSLSRVSHANLQPAPVNLSTLAANILDRLSKSDPGRRVDVHIQNNLVAAGDESLFYILLENLLSNAWKYTARRYDASIRLYALPAATSAQITFCLEDNGAGFDMARADCLFVPFQRLHNHADFPGIGLGLVTVQRILHRHGGTIGVRSAPFQGTTFTLTLPA